MEGLNFFDRFKVGFEGSNTTRSQLESYYRNQKEEVNNVDIKIVFKEFDGEPDEILGGPKTHYGRKNGKFIIKRNRGNLVIDEDWRELWCDDKLGTWVIRLIIESKIRKKLEGDYAIVHASAFRFKKESYVLPAWRHTGKSNTLISAMKEGSDYISDDRLFISAEGDIISFNLPFHILPYNLITFPELSPSKTHLVRSKLSLKISSFTNDSENILMKGINVFNSSLIKKSVYVDFEEDFPKSNFVSRSNLDHLVMLQTSADKEMEKRILTKQQFVNKMSSINLFEWNSELEEIYSAYDNLFDENKVKEVEGLVKEDCSIFSRLYDKYQAELLDVPREENWENQVQEEILDKVLKNR